jgi:hypothetical protein
MYHGKCLAHGENDLEKKELKKGRTKGKRRRKRMKE